MIRTLYFRLVVTFIGVVFISLVISFFTADILYRQDIEKQIQQTIVRQGKEIISLYQQNPSKNIDSYLKSISRLHYDIWLFTNSKNGKYFSVNSKKTSAPFTNKDIQFVKKGGIYYGKPNTKSFQVVGLPFQINNQPHALFIKLNELRFSEKINQIVHTILYSVFIIGSILILIASQYLVRPLKAMTSATKKLSQGNFDIHLEVKQKNELGTLAHSFNRMAKELRELEQMRQDFVSNVSHEIQSPLTSIRGYSEMLKDQTISIEERTAFLDIIQQETERLSRLSENLLKLASLESNHHPFHAESYRLDEQLRRLVAFLEPQWSKKQLKVTVKLEKITVFADQDQLSQVWLNLLSNSIKFTPDEGSIHIQLTNTERQIIVQVTDTGIGIPKDVQPHIFDRFYTGDPARNRLKSGNGLGLSIAKKIVELHDGQIKVDSEEGKTTTFTVTLPKQI
ncbi:HAMP domain-containing histidine kinase [Shimazuella sp. AN120528]|uniref:sensor histidine kinase n=1 Tax=Shimazuella soli TaxID=1892854 RepID=UPI001F110065|nr:HAMP domain-containing sensor histidine kinase [Shimazuella soli]MCH5585177.1 HAMP domain-containing histidine kinase [Shimazuella soli]